MIRAKAGIVIKGKKYQAGQVIKDLPTLDRKWMKEAGYIEECEERCAEDMEQETAPVREAEKKGRRVQKEAVNAHEL